MTSSMLRCAAVLVVLGAGCSSSRAPEEVATKTAGTSLERRRELRNDPAFATFAEASLAPKPGLAHARTRLMPPIEHGADGRYVMRRRDASVFFGPTGFSLALHAGKQDPKRAWGLHASLVDAKPVAPHAEVPTATKINRFVGNDPARWVTGAPTFGRLAWEDVYPGIDLVAEPSAGGFAYRFVVSPGADPSRIVLDWKGALGVAATRDGRGVDVDTGIGTLRVRGLRAFSVDGPQRTELAVRHVVSGSRVSVEVQGWDGRHSLVIDPSIAWASYLGGSGGESGDPGGGVDSAGNFYMFGHTNSSDFPASGAYDSTLGGTWDITISKITTAGALAWATYYGGSGTDQVGGGAVDSAGNVYVSGYTNSSDLPTTGGFDTSYGAGGFDAVAAKFTTAGGLGWSSYLGGSGDDRSYAIAYDGSGSIYVCGHTDSTDFPTTGGYDTSHNGGADIFLTKVSATGGSGSLLWSTYVGGAGNQYCNNLAADSTSVVVVGVSEVSTFPLVSAFDSTFAGPNEAVVFKMAAGGTLTWSSFLGGSGSDAPYGVAIDSASGDVYVGGSTTSADFASTTPFDATFGGSTEGYLVRLKGSTIPPTVTWSSFVGGSGGDSVDDVKLFGGFVFVAGTTNSPDFPLVSAFDSTVVSYDAFLARIKITGGSGAIDWSSFLGGGSGDDYVGGMGIDSVGNIYVGGYTTSSDAFTKSPFDSTLGGTQDLFVTKVYQLALGDVCPSGAACPSGFCVDGVCCDTTCVGACQACTAAKKGSGTNGTCGNIAADTDPDAECAADGAYPSSCKADGFCNGTGACRPFAKSGVACAASCASGSATVGACNGTGTCSTSSSSCGLYVCGATACKTTCATDADCVSTAYCSGTTCTAKKALGSACGATSECASGTCLSCAGGAATCSTGCPDAGPPDTGPADTGAADTAVADTTVADTTVADTTVADTTVADTTVSDTAVADAPADSAATDTGPADTLSDDTGVADTGASVDSGATTDSGASSDTSADSGAPAAGTLPSEACGCRTVGAPTTGLPALLGFGLALLARRRRLGSS